MNRDFARELRKDMTDVEKRLWCALRYRQLGGCKFRRQAPVGPYIVDFVCFEKRLVVELDGGQHAEQLEQDATRTQWLKSQGFGVIRFWNHQVFEELDVILEAIWRALGEPVDGEEKGTRRASIGVVDADTSHPNPPPQGGREPDLNAPNA